MVAEQQAAEVALRKINNSKVTFELPKNADASQLQKHTLDKREEGSLAEAYKNCRAGEADQSEKLLAELLGKRSIPAVAALDIRLKFLQQLNQEAAKAFEYFKAGDDKSFKKVFLTFAKQQDNELLEAWKSQPLSAELCEMMGECFNEIAHVVSKYCEDEQASTAIRIKAIACFRKCILLDTSNSIVHLRLAACLRKESGSSHEVLEHLIAAVENSPEKGLGLPTLVREAVGGSVPDELQTPRLQAALAKLTGPGRALLVHTHQEVVKQNRSQEKLARRIEAIEPNSHPEVWQTVRLYQYVERLLQNGLASTKTD